MLLLSGVMVPSNERIPLTQRLKTLVRGAVRGRVHSAEFPVLNTLTSGSSQVYNLGRSEPLGYKVPGMKGEGTRDSPLTRIYRPAFIGDDEVVYSAWLEKHDVNNYVGNRD